LWKSLWKSPFLRSQISEICGLVALCTHFVQNEFTRLSATITKLAAKYQRFIRLSTVFLRLCGGVFARPVQNSSRQAKMARQNDLPGTD
jgi:hypothetical protein